jgi:hypothetical protein
MAPCVINLEGEINWDSVNYLVGTHLRPGRSIRVTIDHRGLTGAERLTGLALYKEKGSRFTADAALRAATAGDDDRKEAHAPDAFRARSSRASPMRCAYQCQRCSRAGARPERTDCCDARLAKRYVHHCQRLKSFGKRVDPRP